MNATAADAGVGVSLPLPSWPLDRQQALGADDYDPIWAELRRRQLGLFDPLAKHEHYWRRDELPPLYAAAVLFQDGAPILGTGDAKRWLQSALDAFAAKGLAWVPHIQIVKAPTRDGKTFRIIYGPLGLTAGRPASELDISADRALSYAAADFIKHRFMGDVIPQPFSQRVPFWTRILYETGMERAALHNEFVPRVFTS